MSCSSFQGLQSCLEPARLVEPCVLRLKLAPPKSNVSRTSSSPASNSFDHDSKNTTNNTVDMGGWSFLQNLTKNTSENNKGSETIYIPPNCRRPASKLSEKSLEMCTESLGSETGSDGGESSDEMALLCSYSNGNNETKSSKLKETRRMRRSPSFPPPLTSISGSTTVQVRPHREDGRLVLKAVSVSSSKAYFHAERINGRLKLHLMNYDTNEEDEEEEEEEEEEETEETLVDEENEDDDDDDDDEGEEGEEEEEEEEGLEGNNGNGGGEMGMEKLPRPSRCKEGGNGSKSLLNWKPFLVAT